MITTVVGNYPKTPNLPRPARLRKAISDYDAGKITESELHRIEDQVTLEVIDEQVRAGLDLITDGKIRWEDEQTYLARKLTGFNITGLLRYFDSNTYYRQPVCEGRVQWTQPITVRDYGFAAEHSSKPIKAALTGPYTLARLSQNSYYFTFQEFVIALADALNCEARALQEAGCQFIQFDEPAILRHKEDWDIFGRAMHFATRGLNVKTALYTYFGDVSGIYPQILALPFDVIGLDFCQGAANWDVLAGSKAKFNKELGFGIVNARNTKLETRRELHDALDRISQYVSPDRVYVNPTSGLEFLPRERAQEKLSNMVRAVESYEERGKGQKPSGRVATRSEHQTTRGKTARPKQVVRKAKKGG